MESFGLICFLVCACSKNTSVASFAVSPGIQEMARDCIRYWVVVVSVVVGIAALVLIIILLAAVSLVSILGYSV